MKNCLAAAIVLLLVNAGAVHAGVSPTPFRTGLFGVAPGQAVRVSIVNAGDDGGVIAPCIEPDPLIPTVRIRSLAGAVLFETRGAPVPNDGHGAFVDFTPALNTGTPAAAGAQTPGALLLSALTRSRRVQVRAEVELEDGQAARVKSDEVVLTLEVFDLATGRTEFTLPFVAVAFNPQPEPPTPTAPNQSPAH